MKYLAYSGLDNEIKQFKKRLFNNIFFGTSFFFLGSIVMFCVGGKIIDPIYILAITLLFLTIVYIQYNQIVPNGIIVNNTVHEIEIVNDKILVKTLAFGIPFYITKQPKEITFDIANLSVRKVSYPVKPIYDLDNRVLKLTDNKNEVFLIVDYFDEELEGKLTNFR